jgi:hypothetical protein
MNSVEVQPINRLWVDKVWVDIAPFIQRALDKSTHYMNLQDVLEELLNGRMQAVMVFDESKIIGVCTTEVVQTKRKKIFRVVHLGGDDMEEWLSALVETVREGAMNIGATEVEVWGRRGWNRALSCYNPIEAYTVFTFEVCP